MGQEISQSQFSEADFTRFHHRLRVETEKLKGLFANPTTEDNDLVAGLEIEAWLINDAMRPSPINEHYLSTIDEPLASAELAKFNIELNTHPLVLEGAIFSDLHQQLQSTWANAVAHAEQLGSHLMMIGILPTLIPSDLTIANMSDLHRYRALNKQILAVRKHPIHLDITGEQHLALDHDDIMLESATTSLQLHTKVPVHTSHHYYNASIIASAAMVAICGNAPFLFQKDLWHESRIPLFEQAVDIGGYHGAAQGPVKRVSFGTGYARHSLFECFQENLEHFPVLLPEYLDENSASFSHLKLHNGTIWRWNRPLVGINDDGTPHIRIEHRTPAAGPSLIDTVANAAFYYGLTKNLFDLIINDGLPIEFATARDNFYRAAKQGLSSHISWLDGQSVRLQTLMISELIPRAMDGLKQLGIPEDERQRYLGIILERAESQQTGSAWQRQFIKTYPHDFKKMTEHYIHNQKLNKPVSQWPLA